MGYSLQLCSYLDLNVLSSSVAPTIIPRIAYESDVQAFIDFSLWKFTWLHQHSIVTEHVILYHGIRFIIFKLWIFFEKRNLDCIA